MSQTFVQRIVGAARLDAATYEEVEADRSATAQAAAVVGLVAVASGLGLLAAGGFMSLLMAAVGALLGWVVWAVDRGQARRQSSAQDARDAWVARERTEVVAAFGGRRVPRAGASAVVPSMARAFGEASS